MSWRVLVTLSLLAVLASTCSGLPAQKDGENSKKTKEPVKNEETPEAESNVPKITYSKMTSADAGETINLDCEVKNLNIKGLKDFKIMWSKVENTEDDGEKLSPISENKRILVLSDKYVVVHPEDSYRYSLQIQNVNEENSGMYRCTVSFGAGQDIDADVPVSIQRAAYFSDPTTKTMRVAEGDSISIDCQPGGNPRPEVYWERSGEQLPYYGGQIFKANQFELPLVHRTHNGLYVCYADNGLGEPARSEVVIEVEYKPAIELSDENIPAFVYDEISMECVVEAIPEAKVQWKRNGQRVVPSANIIIDTTSEGETKIISKMNILQIQVDDFADYDCVATNSIGEVFKTTRVEMKTPPDIEKQTQGEKIFELPEDQRLRNDLPVAIECVGSGVPAPAYRWTKDNEVLLWQSDPRMSLERGTGTLLIREPTMDDNGKYQCFAYNELGMAASDMITVRNSTMIDFVRKEPDEVEYQAELGRPFRFACPKVIGHPMPALTWMKATDIEDGVEMEFLDGDRMVVDESGVLWISHVMEEDDTAKNNFKFTCLASSELHPQDISLAKTISLKVVPPADGRYNLKDEYVNIETFLMHSSPKEVKFRSNEVNKLWCIFAGEPIPQVIWQRSDGAEINHDRFYVQNEGQTLVFRDTQVEDEGEYECLASNGIGTTKKLAINVNVEVKPKFRSDFKAQRQVINEGTTVTFACDILSEKVAQPKYEWFFNSQPMDFAQGSRRKMEGSNLIIKKTRIADIGNYACKASNDIGYAYGQTTLSVIPSSPSPLTSGGGAVNNKVLANIQTQIESLATDVQSLKDIVKVQSENEKLQQSMAELLGKIAKKVLTSEEPAVEE